METKELAEKYIDMKFNELEMETKKLMPEDYVVTNGVDHAHLLTRDLNKAINTKQDLTEKYRLAVEEELKANLLYEHSYDDMMLNTDFEEVLDKSRPTADDKKAYIKTELCDLYDNKKYTSEKVSMLRKQIEVVDNRISSEKLTLRLILKL